MSLLTDTRPEDVSAGSGRRRYAELIEEAKLADQLGFHAFCTSEQHGTPDGYMSSQMPVLGAIAAATQRIRIMPNCVLLPLYRPRQVLEGAIALDLISAGRLDLGLAIGAYKREYELFNVPWNRRGRLMEAGLIQVREGLLNGSVGDGPGGTQVPVLPRPVQGHVAMLIGGVSPPAVDRAVRLGDGHIGYDYERFEERLPIHYETVLQPAMRRHGRSLSSFQFSAGVSMWVTDDPDHDWDEVFRPAFSDLQRKYREYAGKEDMPDGVAAAVDREHLLIGTPGEIAGRLRAVRQRAPFEELVFWHRPPGVSHQRGLEHMSQIANELMPLLAGG